MCWLVLVAAGGWLAGAAAMEYLGLPVLAAVFVGAGVAVALILRCGRSHTAGL